MSHDASPSPSLSPPPPGGVDLWWGPLDLAPAAVQRLSRLLSGPEAERASRFARPLLRSRFAVAHARLRQVLSRYGAGAAQHLVLAERDGGKPVLLSADGTPSPLRFNLSHSEGVAAVAIARGAEVGVDVEHVRTVEPSLAERFFAAAEREQLARLTADAWSQGFFRCWTRKEAVVKASGRGLATSLDSFAVTLDRADAARVLHASGGLAGAQRWSLLPFALAADLPGAVAVASERPHRLSAVRSFAEADLPDAS